MRFSRKLITVLLFVLVLLVGIGFRFLNLNWDQNQHLHPDERFLTMVGLKLKLPTALSQYLDPRGPFSPYGTGENFFVYGTLPLSLQKIVTTALGFTDYNRFALVGRIMSALIESLTLITISFLAFKLVVKDRSRAAVWSAFLYATCVLPIQLAHFGTVDPFLTFFLTLATLLAYSAGTSPSSLLTPIFAGISWGAALGCKINALFWLPLLVYCLTGTPIRKKALLRIGLFFLAAAFAVRIVDPHLFASSNFFDFRPNPLFLTNLHTLSYWNTPVARFPPGVQWLKTTPLYGLKHNLLWGTGLPLGLIIVFSFGQEINSFIKRKKITPQIILVLFVVSVFGYQSFQFAKPVRYFYPLYPLFCLLAGSWLAKKKMAVWLIPLLFLWPLMFISIYLHPHVRVTASEWIYQNIPPGAVIATEYWDDSLPLALDSSWFRQYQFENLNLYAPETSQKWQTINSQLKKAGYLVISSNRLTGSISQVPELYPETNHYYEELFSGKLGFVASAEFHSFPCFPPLGKPIFCLNDQSADESFTVFDHPRVIIYKKIAAPF